MYRLSIYAQINCTKLKYSFGIVRKNSVMVQITDLIKYRVVYCCGDRLVMWHDLVAVLGLHLHQRDLVVERDQHLVPLHAWPVTLLVKKQRAHHCQQSESTACKVKVNQGGFFCWLWNIFLLRILIAEFVCNFELNVLVKQCDWYLMCPSRLSAFLWISKIQNTKHLKKCFFKSLKEKKYC